MRISLHARFRNFLFVLFGCFLGFSAEAQTGLVISQIYGGGGNSGATYTNDFIELYNPTAAAISLSGLSVQYASATGTSWNAATLPAVSVAAGHFFLIEAAAGSTTAQALPTPDFVLTLSNVSQTFVINLSATAGKVALVNTTTPITVACPTGATILDFVGYGTTANCSEGNAPAPTTTSNAQSIVRTVPGVDTNVNAADFSVISPPNPRNSGAATGPVTPPTVAIHAIQGSKSTTAMTVSPYAGQQVTTTGVVTTVLSNAFFIQSRDSDADADPTTPEGIEVYTGTPLPAAAVIGNLVKVTGTVQTYPAATASHTPATEITSPTVTLMSTGNAMPTAVTLTASMLTPSGGLYQLTPYEGMRVTVPSVTSVSGTNGSITSAGEPTETPTSTGYFYGVITGTARPFREPGIDIRDPAVPGEPSGVAKFDDNPERILIDSVLAGGTSIEISTGAVLTNVTGVLDFTFSNDTYYDPSRLILDASYNRANVTAGMTPQPVALPASTEFTVASFNIERFFNPAQTTPDDIYYVPAGVTGYNGSSSTGTTSTGQTYISEAVDVTPAAYATRLKKVSLAIRTMLNLPDVVTLEEVENENVANDIASQVNSDAGVSGLYTAYSTDNSTYYSQDGTGISVGFLVKNTVDELGFTQYGAKETFTPTSSTGLVTLNDRPWLVLNAGIKRANSKDYPVTVIVNHMKALTGENSTTSTSTRQKKELQAEDIAKYIQTLQAAGTHVISGGDFNAFEFSDGYADTLATYTNTNVLPATQVVQPGVAGLVTPPLTDMALLLPANQRWSYQEDGDAQILDHLVVTPELVAAGAHMAYAHFDADFPLTSYNDPTTPARTSDHDAAVGYFNLPAPVLAGSLITANASFGSVVEGASSSGQVFTFSNTGEGPIVVSGVTATGDFAVSTNCATVAINSSCSANVVFTPTATGARTGTVTFATNVPSGAFSSTVTGTGVAPALATISPNSLTFAAGVIGVNSAAQGITITNSATVAAAIGSIVASGDFSQTNTCGVSLAATSSCMVSVIFKPTTSGTRTGVLTVTTTGYAATTLTATLTGSGLVPDFTVDDSSGKTTTALTVGAGMPASLSLSFAPVNGFTGSITIACAAPGAGVTGATCTPPAPFLLGSGTTTQSVYFTTTSRTSSSGFALTRMGGQRGGVLALFGMTGLLMVMAGRARKLGRLSFLGRLGGLLVLVLAVCSGVSGCSGGGSVPAVNPNGTPAGTYTYTVTASGGSVSHVETVNLTVQ
jgi:predicted extracellular nuclease